MAPTVKVRPGANDSWGQTLAREKFLTLAVLATLLVSLSLFLHRNSGAWEKPRASIIRGSDDWCYYLWLPSVLGDHDVDFRNQYEAVPNWEPWVREEFLHAPKTATGLLPNKYPVGWALASAPWYLTASVLSPEKPAPGAALPSPWVEWWTLFGQWIYGVIGLIAAAAFLARFFGKTAAIWTVLAGWWCSPLLYYQTCALSMSHSLTFALVALIFALTEHLRAKAGGWAGWIFLGLLAGLLLSVRPSALPYLLYPLCLLVPLLARENLWSRGGFTVLAALVASFPQLLAWKLLYGHWLTYSYGDEGFYWVHPQVLMALFSPLHGWFYWHPWMAFGAAGLILAVLRGEGGDRGRAVVLVVIMASVIWINASWSTWWYGVAFGGRAFEGMTLGVMFGLAWWHRRGGFPGRRMLVLLAVLLGLSNLNLVWLSRHWRESGFELDAPVTYAQMIDATERYYFRPAEGLPEREKCRPSR